MYATALLVKEVCPLSERPLIIGSFLVPVTAYPTPEKWAWRCKGYAPSMQAPGSNPIVSILIGDSTHIVMEALHTAHLWFRTSCPLGQAPKVNCHTLARA